MIEWISNWAEAIIIAVIIATIIEMLLPEGNNKKYVKVVIGVYILFTIISPVVTKFTGKSLAVSDIMDLNEYIEDVKEKENNQRELQESNYVSIRDIYIGNVKADIQNKLKGKGYIVININLEVGYDDNYTLNKIELYVKKREDNRENNSKENEDMSDIEIINSINIEISNDTDTSSVIEGNNNESRLKSNEKQKIKEYLSDIYDIDDKNILIY